MRPRHFQSVLTFSVLAMIALGAPANAAIIDLEPANGSFAIGAGWGSARGMLITASASYTVDSIGIFADVIKPVDVLVFSGDSAGGGSIAAQALNQIVVDNGAWSDIAFNFSFVSGNVYTLLWRANDGVADSWVTLPATLYNLGAGAGDDTVIAGAAVLHAGRSGLAGADGNAFTARMRFNGPVPEPTTLALLAAGATMLRRRRV